MKQESFQNYDLLRPIRFQVCSNLRNVLSTNQNWADDPTAIHVTVPKLERDLHLHYCQVPFPQ